MSDSRSNEMEKTYSPDDLEQRWYEYWERIGAFRAGEGDEREAFSIVIPPPNVTGSLHMGHAFNNTLQDILARYHRMIGHNVLWMPGTDHAGIATQNVVERQLAAEGSSRHELGREKFIERVWEWKQQYGDRIIEQLKHMGCSCDWDRLRFTMDEGLSKAVRKVFVTLYKEGLIYRGQYLTNWCPRCETALSDLEVEHEDQQGHLWHIKYPLADGSGELIVATTRPETMFGDTAVAVNPADERYADFIGKQVVLPLVGKQIPVIADDYVSMEFGTGALKITPAHDPNDFEIGLRHSLPMVKVIDERGVIASDVEETGRYAGMERNAARAAAVADLESQGLLHKVEDYASSVGHCYRCKEIIEPNLSVQWFVKTKPLAEQAIKAVRDGRTRIVPELWTKTYYNWMENIRDWCISRQIWWGHRIPAWRCPECPDVLLVEEIDPTSCPNCGGKLVQEEDVLDTWFSSALWPFSTMGWPEQTDLLKTYYPTSCLVTAFDILFFWVARMMMMGLKFMDDVPFHDVYIHALVRDEHGQKMSKSKGNVVDPLVIVDEFGADSFRFTLASLAAQGRDVALSKQRIAGYRRFANKIWNAARFTLSHLEGFERPSQAPCPQSLPDRWILSKSRHTAQLVGRAIEEFRFNDAAMLTYDYIWHTFCDWYLELIKPALYDDDAPAEQRELTKHVLCTALDSLLRMLHPFMPFVSEDLWQRLPGTGETIMLSEFNPLGQELVDDEAESKMDLAIEAITAIRTIRGEMNIAPSVKMQAVAVGDEQQLSVLRGLADLVRDQAKLESLIVDPAAQRPKTAAVAPLGSITIYVPLAGLVDLEAESTRLNKEIDKVDKDLSKIKAKLGNEKFLTRAPEEVVQLERERYEQLDARKAKLADALERIELIRSESAV
ncbi:MAG: valine--tRNA ligase [Candidatus Alcyoniella australis]|nr:valine--tRNA ligase [Candidatus Alcyoniella australis]